jgi:hypothetical protein
MAEIFRLKYRPHTTATAAWYALMQQTTAQYLDHYQAIAEGHAISVASDHTALLTAITDKPIQMAAESIKPEVAGVGRKKE